MRDISTRGCGLEESDNCSSAIEQKYDNFCHSFHISISG